VSGSISESKEPGPGISRHHKRAWLAVQFAVVITLATGERPLPPMVNACSNVRRLGPLYPLAPCREHAALGLLLTPSKPLRWAYIFSHIICYPTLILLLSVPGPISILSSSTLRVKLKPHLNSLPILLLYLFIVSCSSHRASSVSGTVLAGIISAPL